jgi:hypothetical protein
MSIVSRNTFTYIQQAAIPLLRNIAACVLIYRNLSHQGSFKNGVVSAFPLRETIDFTGFWGTFQDTAVTNDNLAKGVKGVPDMHFVGFIFGHVNPPSLIIVRGGAASGGVYAPFILTARRLGWLC